MYIVSQCVAKKNEVRRHRSLIGRSLVSLLFAAPIPTGILFVKVFALVYAIFVLN